MKEESSRLIASRYSRFIVKLYFYFSRYATVRNRKQECLALYARIPKRGKLPRLGRMYRRLNVIEKRATGSKKKSRDFPLLYDSN